MSSLDAIFVYTPLAYENTFAEIGSANLMARLKSAGFSVEQDDLNVRLIQDYWMQPDEIHWLKQNLSMADMRDWDLLYFMPSHISDPHLSVERLDTESISTILRQLRQEGNIDMYHVLMISYMYKRKILLNSYYMDDVKELLRQGNSFLESFFEKTFFAKFGTNLPSMVGMSVCTSEQTYPSLVLAKMIKEVSPNTTVVWGGAWVSNAEVVAANMLREFPYVDVAARFEFVHLIEKLLKAIKSGNRAALSEVENIFFRHEDGRVEETRIIGPPPFEDLPIPDFTGLPLEMYRDKMLPVISARNCWWGKCVFCYHKLNPQVVRYQQRPVDQVYNDIKELSRITGINIFHLADHSTHMKTLMKLADRLITEGPMVKLLALVRPTGKWTKDITRMLAMAGLQKVYLGLETTSQEKLDLLQKGLTMDILEHDLEAFASAGILTRVFVLDFPTQTIEEFRNTLQWILDRHHIIDAFIAERFKLGRNSIIFLQPDIIKITIDPNADFDLNIYKHRYTAQEETPFEEFFQLRAEYLRKFMEKKREEW